MKKASGFAITLLFLIFFVGGTAFAQLDIVLPFLNKKVGDYYVKSRVIDPAGHLEIMTETFVKGDVTVSRTELHGQVYEFAFQDLWSPEASLELFYANYEIRVVGMAKAAGRDGLVVELYRKKDRRLVQKYVIDQEKGLVLNQYSYDQAGNLVQGFEALEVNFDPDFSTIDLENIAFSLGGGHHPLTKGEFENLLPWINLDHLPFPEGFEIIAYSENTKGHSFDEDIYFKEKFPNISMGVYWIWVSDGYETIIIEAAAAKGEEVSLAPDSFLEVVKLLPGYTIIVVAEQPAFVQVHSDFLTLPEVTDILLALTGADEIKNLEALAAVQTPIRMPDLEFIDYASLPQEPISKEEFLALNPWIDLDSYKRPAGFTVTGFARVTYPKEIKDQFTLHEKHSDSTIIDLIVELSDGERFHYLSVSFTPDFHKHRLTGVRINYGLNSMEVVASGPPLSIYSESVFVSEEDQRIIIRELFPGLIGSARP